MCVLNSVDPFPVSKCALCMHLLQQLSQAAHIIGEQSVQHAIWTAATRARFGTLQYNAVLLFTTPYPWQ